MPVNSVTTVLSQVKINKIGVISSLRGWILYQQAKELA